MADRIEQQLGIDAASAIQSLNQLNQSLTVYNNLVKDITNSLGRFNSVGRESSNILRGMSRNANSAAFNLAQLTSANTSQLTTGLQSASQAANVASQNLRNASQSVAAMNRETGRLTVSFETMVRIVTTQVIVRALSQIRDAFRESVSQALELQKQVALITTIAGGAGQAQITEDVLNLSSSLNIPLLETAQGVYNAISNQVGNYSESLIFSAEAGRFAKATNSSLADSVDLLSGAMRAFDLEVEQTGRVAGIFFSAIDKGRVTASELGNTFGRVAEPASQLGIELEEITAGVAAISERGLGAATSLTQFRGVITALSKPTVAMQAALEDLGFTTSEQAISTLGLAGTLESLIKSTDGTSESISALFPNIRGIGGALGLTQENFQTFVDNVRAAQAAGESFAAEKYFQATSTDAERFTSAINAAKNTLVSEFGTAVVSAGAELADFIGGIEGAEKLAKSLVPALENAALSIAAVGIAFGGVKLAGLAAINPLAAALVGLIGASSAFVAFLEAQQDKAVQAALEPINALKSANEERIKATRIAEDERLNATKIADEAILQSGLERLRELNKAEIVFNRDVQGRNQSLIANAKNILDTVVSQREQFARAISQTIGQIDNQIQGALTRIAGLRREQDSRQFEFGLRDSNDTERAESLLSRATTLAQEAESQILQAFQTGDKAAAENARALFQEAQAALQQADAVAQRAGNRELEVQAFAQLQNLSEQQISVEQRINDIQEERRTALEEQKRQQEGIVQELKNQAKIVLDNTGQFNTEGRRFSPEQQASRAQIRQQALQRIGQLQLNSNDFDIGTSLGIAQQIESLQREFDANPINVQLSVEGQIQGLTQQINEGFDRLKAQFPLADELAAALGRPVESISDALNAVGELQEKLNQLRAEQSSRNQLQSQVVEQRDVVLSALAQSADRIENATVAPLGSEGVRDDQKATINFLEQVNAALQRVSSEAVVSQAELDKVVKFGIGALQARGVSALEGLQVSDSIVEQKALEQIIPEIEKLIELQSKANATTNVQPEIDRLNALKDAIGDFGAEAQKVPAALQSASAPAANLETSSSNTADNYERAARAVASIGGGAGLIQAAHSGVTSIQRFAGGGFARGTDTILAGLSRGESVINARASARFASQIQAMNAGQQPIYRSQGGTTVSIGDVHVTNNSSERVDGRRLVQELRREFRKGNGF